MRILIAEDDCALGRFLQRGIEAEGHMVDLVTDGESASSRFAETSPDLTILDLNLPRRDGTEVLRMARSTNRELPILVLTARQDMETRIQCLDLGADDCMLKPFSLMELRARCRALLRRGHDTKLILRSGDLELNRVEHSVSRDGEPVPLTNKEFALLEYLMLQPGLCVSRPVLLEQVWNMKPGAGTNVVDVYVNYLRKKLHDTDQVSPLIHTVRGQGYRLATGITPTLAQA
jgi:DNA-binding response OmpR family regulator